MISNRQTAKDRAIHKANDNSSAESGVRSAEFGVRRSAFGVRNGGSRGGSPGNRERDSRRYRHKRLAYAIGLLMIVPAITAAPPASARSNRDEVKAPQSTLFTLELLSPVGTARNKKGDAFRCAVIEPAQFRSAIVDGVLTKVKASGKASGKSEIAMAFRSITMPNGDTGKFEAQIAEVYEMAGAANQGRADSEGRVAARSYRKRDAVHIALGAGIGALIGGVIAGGKGAAIGAAIGAGLAAAGTLSEKGPDLQFADGTRFVVRTAGR